MRKVKFKVVSLFLSGQKRSSAFASGKYSLDYAKGTIVRAIKGTLGVAVFKTRKQAERFLIIYSILPHQLIRVRPIGRGKSVEYISNQIEESELDIFYSEKAITVMKSPPGTVFYPAVEVIE